MRTRSATKSTILSPKDATTCTTVEYLCAAVEQLEEAVNGASDSRSWQAVGSLKLRALQAREALDIARAKESAPDEGMSDAQLVGIITAAIAQLPPSLLDQVEDAVEMKRRGPRLVQVS
jgi:hypothetical protein